MTDCLKVLISKLLQPLGSHGCLGFLAAALLFSLQPASAFAERGGQGDSPVAVEWTWPLPDDYAPQREPVTPRKLHLPQHREIDSATWAQKKRWAAVDPDASPPDVILPV